MNATIQPARPPRLGAGAMAAGAALALVGFFLPWFSFQTSLPLDLEPAAAEFFQKAYAPFGPLDTYTRLIPTPGALLLRSLVGGLLETELLLLAVALLLLWRAVPLWVIRFAMLLCWLLIPTLLLTLFVTGVGVSIGWPYPRVIPVFGWWLTFAGFAGILLAGRSLLTADTPAHDTGDGGTASRA